MHTEMRRLAGKAFFGGIFPDVPGRIVTMNSLTVLETGGERISGMITSRLRTLPESSVGRSLSFWGRAALQMGRCPDLVVVSRSVGAQSGSVPQGRCGILLLPGTSADMTARMHCSRAVSYGMSKRDSVTFSSFDGDRLLLALQRELPTLTGRVLERQEIPLHCPRNQNADEALASAAALLLLGVPPESLADWHLPS